MVDPKLLSWRRSIDQLDEELLNLLFQRFKITSQIQEWKLSNQAPVEDKERENKIIHDVQSKAGDLGLDLTFVEELFQLILKYSKKQ